MTITFVVAMKWKQTVGGKKAHWLHFCVLYANVLCHSFSNIYLSVWLVVKKYDLKIHLAKYLAKQCDVTTECLSFGDYEASLCS